MRAWVPGHHTPLWPGVGEGAAAGHWLRSHGWGEEEHGCWLQHGECRDVIVVGWSCHHSGVCLSSYNSPVISFLILVMVNFCHFLHGSNWRLIFLLPVPGISLKLCGESYHWPGHRTIWVSDVIDHEYTRYAYKGLLKHHLVSAMSLTCWQLLLFYCYVTCKSLSKYLLY